ncbi:MAG: tRNA preQ1(34) S-adenosylmethionine ribosyltransferase-isomerase QueA [Desulfovibrio sp.]|nr:tRNA preQ1(34) S-adenosylmethionine ribosyltransferase-isomerase QueA [Desulfovibrio sp.]
MCETKSLPDDFSLQSYLFPLPETLIAQTPPPVRGTSRLLVMRKDPDEFPPTCIHAHFPDLPRYLPKGALLVANNSRVIQARLFGKRASGGAVQFLLLTPLALLIKEQEEASELHTVKAEGLLRANARLKPGEVLTIDHDLHITLLAKGDYGLSTVLLTYRGDLAKIIARIGHIPLPPYIKRQDTEDDAIRYQTVYAKEEKLGSVAAPTAGLHFTQTMQKNLLEQGFGWTEITLYVGYGTFTPVRTEDIRKHPMHSEYIEISPQSASTIAEAKKAGRPIIAIGTTSVRTLEGVYAAKGAIVPYQGTTDIFLYPGKAFHVVDGLITNFHLPGSSLLLLVSALVGRKRLLAIYQEAIAANYRFFSYGDCMAILP